VIHLPALCRKMGVPYCIAKGKARLGRVVRRKTATSLALTNVHEEDKSALSKLVESVKSHEIGEELRKHWGGGQMGAKSLARMARLDKAKAKEVAAKAAA